MKELVTWEMHGSFSAVFGFLHLDFLAFALLFFFNIVLITIFLPCHFPSLILSNPLVPLLLGVKKRRT